MSATVSSTDPLPDVTSAVQALLPDMQSKSRLAWMLIALVSIFASAVGHLLVGVGEGATWVYPVMAGALLIAIIVRWTRKAHEKAVMPILASTVGLAYDKDASSFAGGLPARLLPAGNNRRGEDYLSGTVGGRTIRLAEVEVETGGKNSRTLFKGLVANFPNAVAMPPFFIADETQTGRSFWFGKRLDVDGLVQIGTVGGGTGRRYGVWASSAAVADHPALGAVLDILTDLDHRVGGAAQLFSATSNGEETHVALTHKRDLYKIGGLFVSKAKVLADVQAAYRDLTVPLTIAAQLMEAEQKVGETLKKG